MLRLPRFAPSTKLVAASDGGTCTKFFHRRGKEKSIWHMARVTPQPGNVRSDGNWDHVLRKSGKWKERWALAPCPFLRRGNGKSRELRAPIPTTDAGIERASLSLTTRSHRKW